MSGAASVLSARAWDLIEFYAVARKDLTEHPSAATSVALIAAYDDLATYIAGLESTLAALSGDTDVAA